MNVKRFRNELLHEEYFLVNHSSGLKIYLCPKKDYSTYYAIIGTRYGSINRIFKLGDELVETPAGIAHFLEHKLFECEEGDAFTLFSKTGARANANTSFDRTAYLFSCNENFKESLRILMNFVQEPYFTEKGVQKERGIIEQEIKMYDDDPDWKVLINLLGALYTNHPVRDDIAGSVESISHITPNLMNKCYDAFYRFSNMTICLVGSFEVEDILEFLDKLIIVKEHDKSVENIFPEEPLEVNSSYVEEKMEVVNPLFAIGFKYDKKGQMSLSDFVNYNLIVSLFNLKSGSLYSRLLEKNLITTNNFCCDPFVGPKYLSINFSGESENPKEVLNIVNDEVKQFKNNASKELFERSRKCVYSSIVSIFNSPSAIANQLMFCDFFDFDLFDFIKETSKASLDEMMDFWDRKYTSEVSLSVVNPIK